MRVVDHELFALMRDARLPAPALRRFLKGVWPTIEQFPQLHVDEPEEGQPWRERRRRPGAALPDAQHPRRAEARRVLGGVGALVDDDHRRPARRRPTSKACRRWRTGAGTSAISASLAVAIAATNYAVEGATGEWSCVVCSTSAYADSLPGDLRGPSMRWLRVHAEYDDTHPWEALEIVATLLGHAPPAQDIDRVRQAIRTSYIYMEMALDHAMTALTPRQLRRDGVERLDPRRARRCLTAGCAARSSGPARRASSAYGATRR